MDEIKIKATCKELDGGVTVSDVTIGEDGEVSSETSTEGGSSQQIEQLQQDVGDENSGLIKDVNDLEQKTTAMSYSEGVTDFDGKVTGDEIIENMVGYSFTKASNSTDFTYEYIFAGCVKNGNKLTLAIAVNITKTTAGNLNCSLGNFTIPAEVRSKLIPTDIGGIDLLDSKEINASENYYTLVTLGAYAGKTSYGVNMAITNTQTMTLNTKYYVRYELTLLLSENLIPQP